VGHIHHTLRIDETIGGLNDFGSVGAWSVDAVGVGRHEVADFARREWIGDVIGANAGIVQGGENDARTLKRAGPVLPQIMWSEIAALPAVIGFVGNRHGRNAHWVR